jgi:hypothetical protein
MVEACARRLSPQSQALAISRRRDFPSPTAASNRAYSCNGNVHAEYQKLERLGHMGHVREYTTTEVVEFLAAIGFAVTKVIYRGQFHTRLRNLAIRTFPELSPFVSYIAVKPAPRT